MANKAIHPMSFDHAVPRTPAEPAPARSTQRGFVRGSLRSQRAARLTAVIGVAAVIAAFGLFFLLVALPAVIGSVDDLAGIAAATSDAVPADTPPSDAISYGNGPTGYFPDQFTVEHGDDSPLPPQF